MAAIPAPPAAYGCSTHSVAPLAPGAAPPGGPTDRFAVARDDGSIGFRVLDIPAARVDNPRARIYIIDSLKPGTTIRRRVEVNNRSSAIRHVDLYAGAATIDNNTFTAGDDRTANELSSWITLENPVLDVPAHQKKSTWATITVPKTASKGERYAAVWAQVSSPTGDGGNITQVVRVGIRVYLDVGPGGEARTDFTIGQVTVQRDAGQWPVITAVIHNTGERAIDVSGSATLSNGSGAVRAGPFPVNKGVTILPGASGDVTILLDRPLPPGDWDVELALFSGTVKRNMSTKLLVPGEVPVEQPRTTWPYLAGAAAAILLTVASFVLFRRRAGQGAPSAGAAANSASS